MNGWKLDLRAFALAVTAAAFMAALPAGAQVTDTPAATAQASPSTPSDTANVTVFARRQYSLATAQAEMAREHPDRGCVFNMRHDGYKHTSDAFTNTAGTVTPNELSDLTIETGAARSGAGGGALQEIYPCAGEGNPFFNRRNTILYRDKSLDEAFAAYDAGKYAEALPLFKAAYKKIGYEMAALMLGKMYFDGQGTAPDTEQAIYWFKTIIDSVRPVQPSRLYPDRTSKQQFDPKSPYRMSTRTEAAILLARIYETGFNVPKDPKLARKYYMKADDFGFIPATHTVAEMYLSGYGGEKDYVKAVAYFKRAGEVGYTPSQYALGEIYYFGDFGVKQDKKLAGSWLVEAAKGGDPDALFVVGRMYELGEGGAAVDPARALVYYKEAAVKGQPDAETTLAKHFYAGDGVPKDLEGARKLFEQAAKQADPEAMFNLGVMMVNGEGGPKDLVRAYCWFSIAEKGGIEKAGAALTELSAKMTPEERAAAEALLNPKPTAK